MELEQRLDQLDRTTDPYLLTTNRRRDADVERQTLLREVEGKLKEYGKTMCSYYETRKQKDSNLALLAQEA